MRRLLAALLLALPAAGRAADVSVTVLPHASVRYRGEGKVLPQSYVNRFGGNTAPVYRIEYKPAGDWSFALVHTGVFGGGTYGPERVPDLAGGIYQTNDLNVGFTNLQLTRRRPLAAAPAVSWLLELTAARQIFKRKTFAVQGAVVPGLDDVNELSAEGVGFGLAGRHGGRLYGRWEAAASHLVQVFDAKTDASAGQLMRAEAAAGLPLSPRLAVELGGYYQYWFLLGQGDRRLAFASTPGAVISWNRQETRVSGLFVSLRYKP